MSRRRVHEAGLALIKEHEGWSPVVYICPAGKRTIGYGHVIKPGESFQEPISRRQGLELLVSDVATAEAAVERLVTVPLTDNQFAALVSFTFNVGQGNLERSTLLRLLNEGLYLGAADEFPRWCRSKGQVLAGLVRRRAAERALFLAPDNPEKE